MKIHTDKSNDIYTFSFLPNMNLSQMLRFCPSTINDENAIKIPECIQLQTTIEHDNTEYINPPIICGIDLDKYYLNDENATKIPEHMRSQTVDNNLKKETIHLKW